MYKLPQEIQLNLGVLIKLLQYQLIYEWILEPFFYNFDSFVDIDLNNLSHLRRHSWF